MFNARKFKAKVIEKGMRIPELAEKVGINPATMYRKMKNMPNGSNFTINEVKKLCELLELNSKEMLEIFFAEDVA